jgi:VWFA-related protein
MNRGRFFAFLVLALGVPAMAQQRSSESIEVVITNLDVVVTDSHGKHVRGLTAEDFEIREKGARRTVTNLEEINATAPPAATATKTSDAEAGAVATPPSAAPAGRRILLLLDDMSLMRNARRRIIEGARAWVDANVRPADRVMLVSTGRSLTTHLRWTNDPAIIRRALDEVLAQTPSEIGRDRAEALLRIAEVTSGQSLGGGRAQQGVVPATLRISEARAYAERRLHESRQSVSAMTGSLAYFPESDEKKLLILFGEGLQESPGRDVFMTLNLLGESSGFDLKPDLRKFSEVAFRKGVAIYTVNPGFNESDDGVTDQATTFQTVTENRTGYQFLTHATGGLEFFATPPDQALDGITRDLGSYYSLGYRGTGSPVHPGDVQVRVRNGLHARVSLSPAPPSSDAVLRDLVLAHLIEEPSANDLQIALQTEPLPPKDGAERVMLSVLIPIRNLKFERQKGEIDAGFDVYFVTGDEQGTAATVSRGTHLIRWPPDAARNAGERPLQWKIELPIPAGHTRISVAVRDHRSKSIGFATLATHRENLAAPASE